MSQHTNGQHDVHQAEDNDLGDFLSATAEQAKEYVEAERQYLILGICEKVGKAAGSALSQLLSTLAILMVLLFASVALALWIGTMLASNILGFLIVSGIYLVVFLIIHYVARKALRVSVMLNVINSLYDDKD